MARFCRDFRRGVCAGWSGNADINQVHLELLWGDAGCDSALLLRGFSSLHQVGPQHENPACTPRPDPGDCGSDRSSWLQMGGRADRQAPPNRRRTRLDSRRQRSEMLMREAHELLRAVGFAWRQPFNRRLRNDLCLSLLGLFGDQECPSVLMSFCLNGRSSRRLRRPLSLDVKGQYEFSYANLGAPI